MAGLLIEIAPTVAGETVAAEQQVRPDPWLAFARRGCSPHVRASLSHRCSAGEREIRAWHCSCAARRKEGESRFFQLDLSILRSE